MSIQSEIDRINGNISDAYSAVDEMGGTLPTIRNSANLAGAIGSIPSGGVSSFNGRTGDVTPQSGDYTAAMVGAAASSHNQAASTIQAGTFAGQVVASTSGETYSTYCLRNQRLASSDTTPTNNGEICWTYK